MTGMIDDIFELKPRQKVLGITLAALVVYFIANIKMTTLTLPFLGVVSLGWFSLPITLIWILGITNAVNLIDGLDGLATGVAIIALSTSALTGYFFLNVTSTFISIMMATLVAALLGFLPYNFHPAKIYLGDTGSLFIGFMISVFSLYGLKNATFITLIIPVIILGVQKNICPFLTFCNFSDRYLSIPLQTHKVCPYRLFQRVRQAPPRTLRCDPSG